jgi:excinuclease ABC subunit A
MGALADDLTFSMDTPWRALPQRAQQALLHGQNHKVHVRYRNRFGRERSYSTGFEGVVPFIKRRHSETDSEWSRERYEGYMREVPCPVCKGARLKPESLAVLIGGRSIADVSRLAIADAARFFEDVDFTARERQIAERVIKEINARLGFLLDVGLDYLSLDRPAARCPAVRPSASASPPRSGRAWSACSTSSTSRASACTSATTTASSRP